MLPLKTQQSIYIGEITSDYHFEPKGPNPFYHWRSVKWFGEAIPRACSGSANHSKSLEN
jgi:restriction system protein